MAAIPPASGPSSGSVEPQGEADLTLGGYLRYHKRPPAFQGSDGHPYTVSVEVERTPNLLAPFSGYLVFPRWAESGVGIVGHLETPILMEETSRERAEASLGSMSLFEVRDLLEAAIQRRDRVND
jgi:hypothetical protein